MGRVDCDTTELVESIEDSQFELQTTFDKWFCVDESSTEENPDVMCIEFQQILDPSGTRQSVIVRDMKKFIQDKYNCKVGFAKRHKGKNTKWISGIRKLTTKEKLDLWG